MPGVPEWTIAEIRKEMYELEEQQSQPDDEQQPENEGQHSLGSRRTFDSTLEHQQPSPFSPSGKQSHRKQRHIGVSAPTTADFTLPKPIFPQKKGKNAYLFRLL